MIQQEMLQYQKLDSDLNRIEKDLRKNEAFINRKKYKELRQKCEENLIKLEAKAVELKNQLASTQQNMQKVTSIIAEHTKEMEDIKDEDELNYMNKKLSEQMDAISNMEKDIKRILHDGEEISAMFDEINAKLPKILSAYKKSDEDFAKATEEIKPLVNKLKKEQVELQGKIDAKLFEQYKKISETVRPVFVELLDGCRCGGCRMEMPKAQVEAQMQGKDYMRCEHCGRIIYKA